MFARRTESVDAVEIEKLIYRDIENLFGKPNVTNVIERSLLSVTILNNKGEIIGFAAFYDYPSVTDIDCGHEWNELITSDEHRTANSFNSLFLHYFVSRKESLLAIFLEIINTVFSTVPDIYFVFLTLGSGKDPDIFADQFKKIQASLSNVNWFALLRDTYFPRLFIRPAKQEDNDDLVPIFDSQSNVLKQTYGEFYVAEMINAQNDKMKCLVAEVDGIAIGFMAVSTEFDVDMLNYGFFLEPFYGFKKDLDESEVTKSTEHSVIKSVVDITEHSVPLDNTESSLANITSSGQGYNISTESDQFPTITSGGQYKPTRSTVQMFTGKSVAIVIQLFAINEAYEMRSMDFIVEVFKLFPDKDYLIITIPHLVPEFTLLDNFVRITPRPGINVSHELYAFHKASLISNFKVRAVCKSDMDAIYYVISNLNLKSNIMNDIEHYNGARRYESGVRLFAYVAECLDQVVGVAVLTQEEDIEYIRSHYNIEDFIYFSHHRRQEHARLKHFALNPIFKKFSKIFLKEVMRKSHKTSLYYPIYKSGIPQEGLDQYSLPTNLTDLVPVRPRRQIIYDKEKLGINAPIDAVLKEDNGYCLMHINRKLILEPKVTINAKIVVVGASTTGLSFLDYLVFCPHLKFNNLFLVSSNGLPDRHKDEIMIEELMGRDFFFSKKQLEYSAFRLQVNVVTGVMTAIDRKKKFIIINDMYHLGYDHLIITTGLQYTLPCPVKAYTKQMPTKDGSAHPPSRRLSEVLFKMHIAKKIPINFFTVNDPLEAIKVIDYVGSTVREQQSNVIVYGYSFESYCCLHTLMALGVDGRRIHFFKISNSETVTINNPEIEDAIYKTLRDAGVNIYEQFCLAEFNDSDSIPDYIYSATFTTFGPPMRLECQMFISYYNKVVNFSAFRAMNDACLVFDSRLVIDTFFHTNDISIRAAGPVTKFKRRYYCDQWTHAKFNSRVVGQELAKVFLQLFDPTIEPITKPPKEEVPLIPVYNDPLIRCCILPGGFHYLHMYKPSLTPLLSDQMAQSNYGTVLTTGSPWKDEGYFRIHLNQYKRVETITCVRRKPFPAKNYMQLYGMHERALNSLQSRFNEGLINNLFEFFDDTWAIAFYHDRFKDLRDEIKELMLTRPSQCQLSFEELVRTQMADGVDLTADQKREIFNEYIKSGAKTTVDHRLISFITYNYYHLPMYAKPDMV